MVRQSSSNSPCALCDERKFVSVLSNESLPDVKMIHLNILTQTSFVSIVSRNGATHNQNKTDFEVVHSVQKIRNSPPSRFTCGSNSH